MIGLTRDEIYRVSGATYGVCTIDDPFGTSMPNFVTVDYNYESPMMIFTQALNAAVFGCIGGLAGGKGVQGCVIGGGIAAATKTMSYFLEDAYWMYQQAKT